MLARISNFVRYQVAMGVTTTAQQNIDTLLVSGFTGATGAAIYGSAKMLFRAYDIVRETMVLFVFPAASKYYSRNDLSTLRTVLEKSVSFLYLILIPGGIVLAFGAPFIFHLLYATKYDASIPIFRVLLLATLLFPIQMVFGVAMSGMGKIKELFRMILLSFVVNVALATVLLATVGIVGAAIAFVVASGVQALLFLFYIRREVGIRSSQLLTRGLFDSMRFLREHRNKLFS
jgi:O-antigen/teichoic acid export membrane protein